MLPHAKASQIPFCLLALSHPSHGWCRLCTNIKHRVKRILVPSTRTPHCMLRHAILLRAQHPSSSCQRKTKSHVLRCSLLVRVPGSAVRRGEMRTKDGCCCGGQKAAGWRALFGCLEQVNAVERCRDWTQAVQERFRWVKVFVWFFFPQGFGFTSSCFFRSSPAVQC